MENSAKELPNRKVLGRGLAALMPSGPAPTATTAAGQGLRQLPIERVHPNKTQPRKVFDETALNELVNSIKLRGVLQPIVVRREGDGYQIVAGERRWRAAMKAGLREIPAVVKEYSDSDALQVALIENLLRADLDPLEEAESFSRLIEEHGLTHDEVATAMSRSRSAITNSLRLLKLPKNVLEKLADGRMTAGHARALMAVSESAQVEKLATDIVNRKLSVRETEHHARQIEKTTGKKGGAAGKGKAAVGKSSRSAEEASVEERLQRALGTKVRLHHRGGRGRIEVFFHSFDELDSILEKLSA